MSIERVSYPATVVSSAELSMWGLSCTVPTSLGRAIAGEPLQQTTTTNLPCLHMSSPRLHLLFFIDTVDELDSLLTQAAEPTTSRSIRNAETMLHPVNGLMETVPLQVKYLLYSNCN